MDKQNYTVKDLANRWHISEVVLRHKLAAGNIPAFKVGRNWLVTAATVSAVENNILPNQI